MKECSNCGGSGRVVIWGYHGHEVPASRMYDYPLDRPAKPRDDEGKPYDCPECQGRGYRKEWQGDAF